MSSRLLHLCSTEPSFDGIRQWLEENRERQDLLTEAANYQDEFLYTPLHYLFTVGPPLDLVEKLLQLAPDTVKAQSTQGNMPLHMAVAPGIASPQSAEVAKLLFEAYPNAAKVQNYHGNLPIHMALYNNIISLNTMTMLFESYPEAATVQNEGKELPLHLAAGHPNATLDFVTMIFDAYPRAIEMKRSDGCMPLHFALFQTVSPGIVQMLYEAYPEAVQVQDEEGDLPLHFACMYKASLYDLNILLVAYPESLHVENKDHQLPSDCLEMCYDEDDEVDDFVKMSFLKDAVINGLSVHVVTLLLKAFPESCATPDENGNLPLHYACMKSVIDISIDVVTVLVDEYPDSCTIANMDGKTPMDLLKDKASCKDNFGMLLLHRTAAFCGNFSTTSLRFVVDSFPDSILLSDNNRMLPFHHACLNPASSVDILMLFLQLYPESISSNSV